ncbi:ribosomal protection-like ABC-F family protein [Indiicoccus explosivorum]|uniref:ribosomal protection-like ABC-F family protein n=1 Tax=Indiicoccus explosivorum TaxID=1917864 RepID=UPI000B447E51|nr:ABC-F family ATP-binding cassette domain-containing protein [Indiicoccus explosivorum]
MIITQFQQITCHFAAQKLFNSIKGEVAEGQRLGLVGRNGEGKTTLLAVLSGELKPTEGAVTWKRGSTVGRLAQSPEEPAHAVTHELLRSVFKKLADKQEALEKLEARMAAASPDDLESLLGKYGSLQEEFMREGGYEIEARIDQVLNGLKISSLKQKEWGMLSGGERTKVGLAKLLLQEPDLLLLDEPTNHLDLASIEWLAGFINHYKGAVLIVSHDRYFLDETVKEVWELDQGELVTYKGNYSAFVKEREKRLLNEFQQYQDQQKKIRKMRETISRLKEWANRANPPNAGMHRRAKSMEKALSRIEVMERPVLKKKQMVLGFEAGDRSGTDVIRLQGVWKLFGDKVLFSEVSMQVRWGERVAVVGPNGAGKSTLLGLLLGREMADEGEIRLGSRLSIGYLSQHAFEMDSGRSIIEEFREAVPVAESDARHLLAKFLFFGSMVFQPVRTLSGGERMRLRLAQLMHQNHNLLILDEPTNHLDLEAKEVMEEALAEYPGTIVAVSHDRYFLDKLFNVTYWLEDETLERFEGSYTEARRKRSAGREKTGVKD